MGSRVLVESSFTGLGVSAEFGVAGRANLQLRGGAGTVWIERKLKGQAVFYPDSLDDGVGTAAAFTVSAGQVLNLVIDEPEPEVTYRLNCTVYGSQIDYRVSR